MPHYSPRDLQFKYCYRTRNRFDKKMGPAEADAYVIRSYRERRVDFATSRYPCPVHYISIRTHRRGPFFDPTPSDSTGHGIHGDQYYVYHQRLLRRQDRPGVRIRGAVAAASQSLLPRLRAEAPPLCVRRHGARGHGHQQADQTYSRHCGAFDPDPRQSRRQVSALSRLHISGGCAFGHWFVQHHHHVGLLVFHRKPLSITKDAVPSHPLRHVDGRSDGFSHRQRGIRRLHRSEGQLSCELEQDLQHVREVLQARRQLRGRLPRRLHRPRLARRALFLFSLPSQSLMIVNAATFSL